MTSFCLDCRTVLRGASSCAPQHRVVDLGTSSGQQTFRHELFVAVDRVDEGLLPSWRRSYYAAICGALAVGAASYKYYVLAGVFIIVAIAAAGFAFGSTDEPKPKQRRVRFMIAARAEPPALPESETLVGTIVSSIGTRSPLGHDDCAGWALEVSLGDSGVMLRDGVTGGMSLELDDGRTLTIPSGMLRLARRARSDEIQSALVSAHVRAVDSQIPWDEARAIELRVGDRVEIVARVHDPGISDYRDARSASLTTVDVPIIRRA